MQAEKMILRMFEVIDANAFDDLIECVDSDIVYERPGFDTVTGWSAFLNFYRRVRLIGGGVHSLHDIVISGSTGMSCGQFKGVLKEGEPVEVGFSELYRFNDADGVITFRRTYFFQRSV